MTRRTRWLLRLASLASWACRQCLRLQSWATNRALPPMPIRPEWPLVLADRPLVGPCEESLLAVKLRGALGMAAEEDRV